jgi:HK97 family phage major capsid protein
MADPLTPEEVVKNFEAKISEKTEGLVSKEEMTELKNELASIKELAEADQTTELKEKFVEIETAIKGLKEEAKTEKKKSWSLVESIKEKASAIKEMIAEKKGVVMLSLKAQQNPSDIGDRDDYAQFLEGTGRKPVRATRISDLFRRVSVSTEYVKYREEDVVTRDASVVVACATSTSTTKKTWVNRTVQIAKIRDFVDVCIDMMEDYSFVASEIEQLVNESVKLKEDSEIMLGAGNILSIDTISSIFDPANVLAPYTGAFASATLAELTAAMKAQIYTFGQENSWNANTIVMNYNDWVKFMHQKNADGDYLLPNFVMQGDGVLNGMRIVTSPIIAPNTLYVFDSTKGEILDRQGATLELSYENNDNFEHEIVTIKAVERLQFHVSQINQDAFMKCDDIATNLGLITAP